MRVPVAVRPSLTRSGSAFHAMMSALNSLRGCANRVDQPSLDRYGPPRSSGGRRTSVTHATNARAIRVGDGHRTIIAGCLESVPKINHKIILGINVRTPYQRMVVHRD